MSAATRARHELRREEDNFDIGRGAQAEAFQPLGKENVMGREAMGSGEGERAVFFPVFFKVVFKAFTCPDFCGAELGGECDGISVQIENEGHGHFATEIAEAES
jgi:hypothetical protein